MKNLRQKQAGIIYVLEMVDQGFFKVGWCKRQINLRKRVARLQPGNPFRLRVIAIKPLATLDDEIELHERLKGMDHARWLGGEWFTANKKLESFIDANRVREEGDERGVY
jgi:hypothetical protein